MSVDQVRAALFRSRSAIMLILLCSIIAGVVAARLVEPRFRSTATVRIDQQAARVLGTEDADPSAAIQDADRFLQTQVDILRSREMAARVVELLDVYNNAVAQVAIGLDSGSKGWSASRRREETLSAIDRNLSVELPVDSRLIQINFISSNPTISARIANGFADAFVSSTLARRTGPVEEARTLLADQLAKAELGLVNAERAVSTYARQNSIIKPSTNGDSSKVQSIVETRLASLNLSHANATARRIDAEQRWQRMRTANAGSLPEVINNPAYQTLLNQLAVAKAENEEQSARRRSDHPVIQQIAARQSELNRQLASFGGGVRSSIQAEFQTALAQERALAAEVSRMKLDSFNEKDRSVQLGKLERDAEKARTQYDAVLQRFNEVNAQSQGQLNNVTILGRATPPFRPTGGQTLLRLAMALVLGVIMCGIYVFLRESGPRRLRTPTDIGDLGIQLLGTLPDLGGPPAGNGNTPRRPQAMADAALSIAIALDLTDRRTTATVVALTSNDPGEGKTTTAVALATELAATGVRTLIIDLDLRAPSLADVLAVPAGACDVTHLLARECNVSDAVRGCNIPKVDALVASAGLRKPAELLAGGKVGDLLAPLRKTYDAIVIDCPPILDLADALLIARASDLTVIIAESGKSRIDRVMFGIQRLIQAGTKPAGLILNRFEPVRQGFRGQYGHPEYGHADSISSKNAVVG
jgi:polysaccharide biosynthesis transport protein